MKKEKPEDVIPHWKNLSIENIVEEIDGVVYEETWQWVDKYEGLFEVSDFGRIRKTEQEGKIIKKQRINGTTGYCAVDFRRNGGKVTRVIHRIIGLQFIENPLNKKEVNHVYGIKWDNRKWRLEWMTPKENSQHAYDMGLHISQKGEDASKAKLTNKQALYIFRSKKPMKELAEKFGIMLRAVAAIKAGETWGGITGKKYERVYLLKEDVIAIFYDKRTTDEIMAHYKLSRAAVCKIRCGWSWKRITSKLPPNGYATKKK